MKYSKFVLFSFAAVLYSGTAMAQQYGALEAEVEALREDVKVLQRDSYRSKSDNALAPGSSADMALKVGDLDENLRNINGRIDELSFKIKGLDERLTMINRDIDVRIKMLEGAPISSNDVGGQGIQAPKEKFGVAIAKDAPKAIVGDAIAGNELPELKTKSADELYQSGLEALKANNYNDAEKYFDSVLRRFPKDKLAANAQYWLGEVYYGRKDYKLAAKAFAEGLKNYKNGAKGPDSLLKLGLSFVMLDNQPSACTAFTSMKTEFPKAPEELKIRAGQEASKLSCK